MLEERGLTPIDRLSNIIQVIQLGRKSGQLLVERGEGRILERGEITFSRGKITEARWNNRSGQEALNQLSTWETCRFMFTYPMSDLLNTIASQSTDTDQAIDLSIPQRTISDDKALRVLNQAGLSRSHLRLFLLIDGKRTINELTRLVGKKYEDVHQLLQDLERRGLIYKHRKEQ